MGSNNNRNHPGGTPDKKQTPQEKNKKSDRNGLFPKDAFPDDTFPEEVFPSDIFPR